MLFLIQGRDNFEPLRYKVDTSRVRNVNRSTSPRIRSRNVDYKSRLILAPQLTIKVAGLARRFDSHLLHFHYLLVTVGKKVNYHTT